MNGKKIAAIALCTVLTLGVVTVASAEQGDANDPLVTLSYLTRIFTPQAESKVDEAVKANEETLKAQLDMAISSYEQRVDEALASAGATFVTHKLARGEARTFEGGHEVLVVSGAATAVGTLTDTTAGVTLTEGEALSEGHLYITAEEGSGVKAADAVEIMSR